jgi:hypothetical protein
LVAYLIAFALIVTLLVLAFVRQRAETPTIVVGPGTRMSTAEKSDSGGWGFGTGVVVTLIIVIGGAVIAKRQPH